MSLQTERLVLVPCSDEAVVNTEYEMGPHIIGFLEELKGDPSLLGWGPWLVMEKETNTVIGDIGFKGKADANQAVEVGYGIDPAFQNKGYATEAVKAIMQWAFGFEGVTKVIAECLEDNYPSIKVLEKLEMKGIGRVDNMLKWEYCKG